jgi:hypothetical protein
MLSFAMECVLSLRCRIHTITRCFDAYSCVNSGFPRQGNRARATESKTVAERAELEHQASERIDVVMRVLARRTHR